MKDNYPRYCYVLVSKEMGIVGVYTSTEKAIDAGVKRAHTQGATEVKVQAFSKDFINIQVIETETPVEIHIERHRLE